MNVTLERKTSEVFKAPLIILALLSISFNSLLVHVLRRLKKLRNISYKFVVLLSISDIGIGVSVVILYTLSGLCPAEYRFAVFVYSYANLYVFGIYSFNMICLISVDRYLHMKYLTRYSVFMTERRAVLIVVIAAIHALSFAAYLVYGRIIDIAFPVQLALNILIFSAILIILTLYIKAYRAIRARTHNMNLENGSHQVIIRRRNPSKEFSKSVLFILSALVICYTPYSVLTIAKHQVAMESGIFIEYLSICFIYANSSLNAVILLSFNKDLRSYVSQCFKGQD